MENRSVLIIDDEDELRNVLAECFSDMRVLVARNGIEGFEIATKEKPDIILLDINMPSESGLRTCEKLRSNDRTKHIPVLMLTAQSELSNKLEAFGKGADDFIEKPFKISELKARVASKMRRLEELNPSTLSCGNLQVNLDKMEAKLNGQTIVFSTLEFNLLKFFLHHKDKVVSRNKILSSVWVNTTVSDRTVDTHLVSLRKKLHDFDHELATIYGAGYILRKKTELSSGSADIAKHSAKSVSL